MSREICQAILDDNDHLDIVMDCTVQEGLGIIDTLITTLVEHTGLDRNALLDNFKEPKGEDDGK